MHWLTGGGAGVMAAVSRGFVALPETEGTFSEIRLARRYHQRLPAYGYAEAPEPGLACFDRLNSLLSWLDQELDSFSAP